MIIVRTIKQIQFEVIQLVLCISLMLVAPGLSAQNDSMQFSFDVYKELVRKNHPLILQANLNLLKGESQLRKAKGGFDPRIQASFDNKEYQGKDYYSLSQATVKIPTPFAVELKGGFELNDGVYLNQQDQTPDDGLYTAGLSLPLLQGLVMDERRTALRQARAFQSFSNSERLVMTNELLLKAYNGYWEWWSAQRKVQVAEGLAEIAKTRLEAVKQRAFAGQAPLIDTLEAHIQWQMRRQNTVEARILEIKNRMLLSAFVWSNGDQQTESVSMQLPSQARSTDPEIIDSPYAVVELNFLAILDTISDSNPYLQQFDAKLEGLYADEKWKREKLKPRLNANYNLLSGSTGSVEDGFGTTNYKWGFDFYFPVLLRESRGDLELTRIKIAETKLELNYKKQELKNKALAVYQNVPLFEDQLRIASDNRLNYERLLDAERIKFFNGESTLFLVNQREIQYADAQNKVIDLQLKLQQTKNELLFLTGFIQ
ncbi:MAG: TolC family protein [Flavobacteriales bacterium]